MVSGYMAMAANTLYTFASIPLALHYLSREEFGLWALVMQISGYLALVDAGMSGSVARILIDYKDQRSNGRYGSVFYTGAIIFCFQGIMVMVLGLTFSPWLPGLFKINAPLSQPFQLLMVSQALLLGGAFCVKIFSASLQSHQRFDVLNVVQLGHFALCFGTLWFAFEKHFGLYSMLIAAAAGFVFTNGYLAFSCWKLGLLPSGVDRCRPSWETFRELFLWRQYQGF